jgi:hypothetical protein
MSQIDLSSFTCNIKKPTMVWLMCQGVTKAGTHCSYRGRHNGYCKIHADKKLGDCPICYEEVTKGTSTTTRCKHVFHKACLERWMEEKPTCPMCRENIRPTTGQLRPRTWLAAYQREQAEAELVALRAVSAAAHYGTNLTAFWREQAEAVIAADEAVLATEAERVAAIQQESLVSNRNVHYINSENELDDLLISVRNAPIDIRFTSNYWEG